MHGEITGAIHNFIVDMAKRKRIAMALAALALFVAGGVFWQLRLMGVTMESPDRCDPAADVESSAAWEAALPERTGIRLRISWRWRTLSSGIAKACGISSFHRTEKRPGAIHATARGMATRMAIGTPCSPASACIMRGSAAFP